MKTRLDALLRKLETDCERLTRAHEAAVRDLAHAGTTLAEIHARLRRDDRGGAAADWAIAEVRRQRLEIDARLAAEKVQAAAKVEAAARAVRIAGHQRAEAIRRAAARIRLEAQRARESRESRELDEVALVRHRRGLKSTRPV
jgi:hypothetical protein